MPVPDNLIEIPIASLSESHPDTGLVLVNQLPLERNPAAVYLASLSPSGRRTQKTVLDTIARMLTGDKANVFFCNWANVGYQHSAAIRSQLATRYSLATTNKMLCDFTGFRNSGEGIEIKNDLYQRLSLKPFLPNFVVSYPIKGGQANEFPTWL